MQELFYNAAVTSLPPDGVPETLAVTLAETADPQMRRYVVKLTTTCGDQDGVSAGTLSPADARSVAEHLWNAANMADQADETVTGLCGARALPTISLCGTEFFIDERLRQLRNVDNPSHYFDLDESKMWA